MNLLVQFVYWGGGGVLTPTFRKHWLGLGQDGQNCALTLEYSRVFKALSGRNHTSSFHLPSTSVLAQESGTKLLPCQEGKGQGHKKAGPGFCKV